MILERNGRLGHGRTEHDHQMRRRWLALAVIIATALAGALLGQLSVVRNDPGRPVPPGPLGNLF